MSSLKDILSLVVGIAAAIFAVYEFVRFLKVTDPRGGTSYAIWAGVAAVIAIICGVIFFAGRVNKEEEIHITQ